MRRALRLFCYAPIIFCTAPAHAWGDDGHKVIGLIAYHYLTPETKSKVDDLLSGPALPGHPDDKADVPSNIADRATWADKYRDSDRGPGEAHIRYSQTHNWHFVDMELDQPDLDAACHGHPVPSADPMTGDPNNCVVDKIKQFTGILKDAQASRESKTVALEFLLHFVGDVHQPLHAADHHDRGGNQVKVRYSYRQGQKRRSRTTNLHSYWDSVTVARLGSSPETTANMVISDVPAVPTGVWQDTAPETWARSSFDVAQRVAYNLPASSSGTVTLTSAYATRATGAARKQLAPAGYRLANLLNGSLQ